MKFGKRWMVPALLLGSLLCACTPNAPKGTTPKETTSSSKEASSLKGNLVIYSTHAEKLLEAVAKGFNEKHPGVKVDFINLKGELGDRVRSEAAHPQSDIMYGGASSLFIDLAAQNLFAPSTPEWAGSLRADQKDEKGLWFAAMQTPLTIFYNSEKLKKEEAPKSWADLTSPKMQGKIVSRDALSSSQRAIIAALWQMQQKAGGDEAAVAFLKKLDRNTLHYYGSGSLHFQAVGKGEAPVSYGVLSAVLDNVQKNKMPLEIVAPQEGMIVLTDCVAKIKGGPNPENAEAFMQYVGSLAAQTMLAKTFDRMPTSQEAITASGKKWMQETIEAMPVDWPAVSKEEDHWLNRWTTEIRDAGKDKK
ncbi:hypothetical protein ABB02_00725 [Clostridiaceae bacterium JG1575]|nr:hypothetical protein ABB02_00725 [Clostridiaceae bacterium JG1575]